MFRHKLTARSYSLARDAKGAKKFVFLLFAETPKSKKQLTLRAELMSISDLSI